MHISALLDIDVIALESEDELTVALAIEAPAVAPARTRQTSSIEVVLDCSGSMADGRLEAGQRLSSDSSGASTLLTTSGSSPSATTLQSSCRQVRSATSAPSPTRFGRSLSAA